MNIYYWSVPCSFLIVFSIFGISANNTQAGETNSAPSFLTNGLSAFYPFNGNTRDESGNNRNGTVYNSEMTADRFGRTSSAYLFNGVNKGFIILPEQIGIAGATNLTISLWFRTDSSGLDGVSRNIFARYNWINAGGVPSSPIITELKLYSTNTLTLNIDDYGTWLSKPLVTKDIWHHVAFTLSGDESIPTNRIHIYFNGQLQDIQLADGPTYISYTRDKSITAIGALVDQYSIPSNDFDGSIDDVRIYTRTLTAAEIASLYAYETVQRPSVSIAVKSVRVTISVEQGKTYQLKTSTDSQTWVTNGPPFVATAPQLDQDFDVTDGQRYFQLIEVP